MSEFDIEQTKMNINNFLWSTLPPMETMQDAENISLDILQLIEKSWRIHFDNQKFQCANKC